MCAHLKRVSQGRVQHREHGQVGTQIWHHAGAQALRHTPSNTFRLTTPSEAFDCNFDDDCVCWRVCCHMMRNPHRFVAKTLHRATPLPVNHRKASTQAKSCKPTSPSPSVHFLPSVWLWSRAEAFWCRLADSCPAESREHAGKLQGKQSPSGCKRDSGMMTKQQTRYITVLSSTERLLTGCGWMWEGGGCVRKPSHPHRYTLLP